MYVENGYGADTCSDWSSSADYFARVYQTDGSSYEDTDYCLNCGQSFDIYERIHLGCQDQSNSQLRIFLREEDSDLEGSTGNCFDVYDDDWMTAGTVKLVSSSGGWLRVTIEIIYPPSPQPTHEPTLQPTHQPVFELSTAPCGSQVLNAAACLQATIVSVTILSLPPSLPY